MPKISIIVPVYKVEQYLSRCLDSIVNQTFTDWECILVDDGSPDNSGKICNEYAEKDGRFRVFHQENAGVSAARNKGLDEAKGECCIFVDSDDWLESNAISIMSNTMDNSYLIIGGIKHIDIKSTKEQSYHYEEIDKCCFIDNLFGSNKYGYLGYLFPKMYDTKIVKLNNLRFNEKIYYNEDRLFLLQYVLNCKKIIFLDNVIYNYFIRDDSAMGITKSIFSDKMITELTAFNAMLQLLSGNSKELLLKCSVNAFNAACLLERKCNNESSHQRIKEYKNYFFSVAYQNAKNILKLKLIKTYIRSLLNNLTKR